jgi:hypothetical protein
MQGSERVILAANEVPSINDVTAAELQAMLAQAPQVRLMQFDLIHKYSKMIVE